MRRIPGWPGAELDLEIGGRVTVNGVKRDEAMPVILLVDNLHRHKETWSDRQPGIRYIGQSARGKSLYTVRLFFGSDTGVGPSYTPRRTCGALDAVNDPDGH